MNRYVLSHQQQSQATDDQITLEMDPWLPSPTVGVTVPIFLILPVLPNLRPKPATGNQADICFNSLFPWHAVTQIEQAVDIVLDCLAAHVPLDTAGALRMANEEKRRRKSQDIPLAGTRQSGSRSYRRPPESLLGIRCHQEEGEAVLARNVMGDEQLATENSRGELDAESVIMAPARDQRNQLRGVVHVTTTAGTPPLGSNELEFIVATCEILGESLGESRRPQTFGSIASAEPKTDPGIAGPSWKQGQHCRQECINRRNCTADRNGSPHQCDGLGTWRIGRRQKNWSLPRYITPAIEAGDR